MKEENSSIHEFDFKLICEFFNKLNRQGPGSPEITCKALSFIEGLTNKSRIADIGCGTGKQTLTLAENTTGHITGIDIFPDFIETMNNNIRKRNLQDRMTTIVGSMDNLPFAENEIELMWSEGAIYNIGFQRGLSEWRKFIKPGGYIAVSEVSWFTDTRADEINDFWVDAYPEIDTIPNKVLQMQQEGYVPVATFVIPVECWVKHFYAPMPAVEEEFLKEKNYNKAACDFIENQRYERSLYMKYKDYYGYVFYIGKKFVD